MLIIYGGTLLLFFAQGSRLLRKDKDRLYCVAIALFLFWVSAMKEITANGDLLGYFRSYQMLPIRSFRSLFDAWRAGDMKDFGFYAFGKLFADFGVDADIWMGVIALFFAVVFGWFIYCHSDQKFLSTLILLTLYFRFTLSGLRQTVALAIVLIAFHYIVEEKKFPFVGLVLLAFLFHSSALIFLPAYWIAKLKIGWKQIAFIAVALAIALVFPGLFRSLVTMLAWNESLANYADRSVALTWSGYIIQLFIVGFCLVFYKSTAIHGVERQRQIGAFLNCMVIGLCLQGFSAVVAEAFRLSYYYSICCVAAVPNVIKTQISGRNKNIMLFAVGASLVAYMIWSGSYQDLVYSWQV